MISLIEPQHFCFTHFFQYLFINLVDHFLSLNLSLSFNDDIKYLHRNNVG
jgi:hypothetical protein